MSTDYDRWGKRHRLLQRCHLAHVGAGVRPRGPLDVRSCSPRACWWWCHCHVCTPPTDGRRPTLGSCYFAWLQNRGQTEKCVGEQVRNGLDTNIVQVTWCKCVKISVVGPDILTYILKRPRCLLCRLGPDPERPAQAFPDLVLLRIANPLSSPID